MESAPDAVELVYSDLLSKWMAARRASGSGRAERLYKTIRVFEEEWPEETARWQARMTPNPAPTPASTAP